jgi:hypothetical protein
MIAVMIATVQHVVPYILLNLVVHKRMCYMNKNIII